MYTISTELTGVYLMHIMLVAILEFVGTNFSDFTPRMTRFLKLNENHLNV